MTCHFAFVLRTLQMRTKAEVGKTISNNLVIQARGDGGLGQGGYSKVESGYTYLYIYILRFYQEKKVKIQKAA